MASPPEQDRTIRRGNPPAVDEHARPPAHHPDRPLRGRTRGLLVLVLVLATGTITAAALGAGSLAPLAAIALAGAGIAAVWAAHEAQRREERLVRLLDEERTRTSQLRRADAARRDLLAVTDHELRTPLTAVKGSASLLADRTDQIHPQQAAQLVRGIVRQADRMLALLDDLGNALRAEVSQRPTVQPVSLAELVDDVRHELSDVDFQVLGRVDTHVLADRDRLEQVLINLLRNAREHGGGTITLSWSADEGRACSRIQVSDEGPGVPDDLRSRIFDRWVSGRPADSEAPGSGLGLAISRELVATMGGTLDLLRTDTGAVFSATLPLATTRSATASAARTASTTASSG